MTQGNHVAMAHDNHVTMAQDNHVTMAQGNVFEIKWDQAPLPTDGRGISGATGTVIIVDTTRSSLGMTSAEVEAYVRNILQRARDCLQEVGVRTQHGRRKTVKFKERDQGTDNKQQRPRDVDHVTHGRRHQRKAVKRQKSLIDMVLVEQFVQNILEQAKSQFFIEKREEGKGVQNVKCEQNATRKASNSSSKNTIRTRWSLVKRRATTPPQLSQPRPVRDRRWQGCCPFFSLLKGRVEPDQSYSMHVT